MVIETDSFGRIPQRRDRVHKACGQAAETSASQRGFGLAFDHIVQLLAVVRQELLRLSVDPEIDKRIEQKSPREELSGNVIDLLFPAVHLADRKDPLDQKHQDMVRLFVTAFFQRFAEALVGKFRELTLHIHHHNVEDHVSVTHFTLLSVLIRLYCSVKARSASRCAVCGCLKSNNIPFIPDFISSPPGAVSANES